MGSILSAVLLLGLAGINVEAAANTISLDITEFALPQFKVPKSSEVKLNNNNVQALENFTVIQVASGKRMLTIKSFEPGQSMNMAFDRAGIYIICYSMGEEDTCLQVNVVGLTPA